MSTVLLLVIRMAFNLALPQQAGSLPLGIHDIELVSNDQLLEEHGPSRSFVHVVGQHSVLHVSVTSEDLDPLLKVSGPDGSLLASDEDSGGGTSAYLRVELEAGATVEIAVAATTPGEYGTARLKVASAPHLESGQRAGFDVTCAQFQRARQLAQDGDPSGARALVQAAVSELLAVGLPTEPEGDGASRPQEVVDVLPKLAGVAYDVQDIKSTWQLMKAHVTALESTLPPDHEDLLNAWRRLGVTLYMVGDFAGARKLHDAAYDGAVRSHPENIRLLLACQDNLANTLAAQGDLEGALELQQSSLALHEASFPAGHREVLSARENLALTLFRMGDEEAGRAHLDEVVRGYQELGYPDKHPLVLRTLQNLGAAKFKAGDLHGARALFQRVVEAYLETHPEDHHDVLLARSNMAAAMMDLGDLEGALIQLEQVLAIRLQTHAEDHVLVLPIRQNLAKIRTLLGDLDGAQVEFETILAAFDDKISPSDRRSSINALLSLASVMKARGDFQAALDLETQGLELLEGLLSENHPDVLVARNNLAASLKRLGDIERARQIEESVLLEMEARLAENQPHLLRLRQNLGRTLRLMGDLSGAATQEERALAGMLAVLPEGHPHRTQMYVDHARTRVLLGEPAEARELLTSALTELLHHIDASAIRSPRELRATIDDADGLVSNALSLALVDDVGGGLEASLFEVVETLRHVSNAPPVDSRQLQADPATLRAWQEAADARRQLNDLVAKGMPEGSTPKQFEEDVWRISRERDRLEREVRGALASGGILAGTIGVDVLGEALPPGSAAVGYRIYGRGVLIDSERRFENSGPHLLAHVVRSDGSLRRVELGPVAELESLVGRWRSAIGRPTGARGIEPDEDEGQAKQIELSVELRKRLLEPVLAETGGASTLHLCLDGFLHLVPIEALPLDQGVVGEQVRLIRQVSMAGLVSPSTRDDRGGDLVALGGVDYAAENRDLGFPAAAVPAVVGIANRGSGLETDFRALPQTKREVETIARLFREQFEDEPDLLLGVDATKTSLHERVSGARFVHLATHGWFAPDTVPSSVDDRGANAAAGLMTPERSVRGFAPMTLCGLALAGANQGRDKQGRVPGILTAEELCTFDLSACELAVLSACETTLGRMDRAGQGVQSLQAALLAAGARTTITSLWNVDDAATRRLMESFYTNLWTHGMSKSDALWAAKQELRTAGHGVVDWGGWVLTGAED